MIEHVENLCLNCMQDRGPTGKCVHCGFDITEYTVKPHHLEPFTILNGRYLLGKVLGEGGFGITYSALDLAKEERVAIKELFISGLLARRNTRTVLVDANLDGKRYYYECKQKFVQEADLLQKMGDKQGIVDIYNYFEENDTAYIVMEYLPGEDIRTILKKQGGKISFEEAFKLLRPPMRTLIELHSMGIYHRDISPDNIRRLTDGRVKLMDFGGAKSVLNTEKARYVAVKRGYAPPEQYELSYKIGPWMDVYSMAATFYRCICGKVPKDAKDRQSDDDIQKPIDMGVKMSPQAQIVLLKGLALQTEDRYMDMREFYNDLKKVPEIAKLIQEESGNRNGPSGDIGTSGNTGSSGEIVQTDPPEPPGPPSPGSSDDPNRKRNIALVVAAAAAVLVIRVILMYI